MPDEDPQHGAIALEMRGVTKEFPGVRALDGVALTVHRGEVHALLGENGAGKSTLMNVLAGVFSDYGGTIAVERQTESVHSPADATRLGIAMIHQELNLVPELSVAENIFLGREPRTSRGTVDRRRMERESQERLRGLGLRIDPRRPVGRFRVGEQQLIEVAKALTLDVRVLVMDEPTSALADAEVERLFEVIRDLAAQGVAVIYISHRLEELYAIADTVTVLRDGRHVATVPMAETGRDALVQMMVGRPLSDLYPRRRSADDDAAGLRVEGLSLRADDDTGRAALHDVSLEVAAGEIVGLAGLMGSGRTEVLEALYGAYGREPVSGRVTVNGRPSRPRSPRTAIRDGLALVPEDRKRQGLVLGSSVLFNASLSVLGRLRRRGLVDARRERRLVREQVDGLRIKTPSVETVVQTLSGGNQQKVVLARCLLTRPRVVLLDEPTRGIDVGAKSEIYALMSELAAGGAAIVMVSSELPELLAMCDRVVVLCEGRVTAVLDASTATQEEILTAAMAREVAVVPVGADTPSGPERRNA